MRYFVDNYYSMALYGGKSISNSKTPITVRKDGLVSSIAITPTDIQFANDFRITVFAGRIIFLYK